jgi:GntR family transcriptional regulator, sialic acid-inducible nan operon repressor
MSKSADPIMRPKLFQEVARRIEQQILGGVFQPGDQLPSERDLMTYYNVGRPAVREALFSLQKAGLVAISSGERARITMPSTETILNELSSTARFMLGQPGGVRSFQQARLLFEVALARFAAQHATSSDIDRLAEALARNEGAVGAVGEFERTDVAFHFVIAQIPNNPIFTALHSALAAWLVEQRTTSLRSRGAERDAVKAHKKIFTAIAARDVESSAKAMEAHLAQVAVHYWRQQNAQQTA